MRLKQASSVVPAIKRGSRNLTSFQEKTTDERTRIGISSSRKVVLNQEVYTHLEGTEYV